MRYKRVGFDYDDVLVDFWQTALPILNEYFGTRVTRDMLNDYAKAPQFFGVDFLEFTRAISKLRVLEQLQPIPGAAEAVQAFRDAGYEITVITSRGWHPKGYIMTRHHMEEHRIAYDSLQIKCGGLTKADYIEGQLDLYVDDLPQNLSDVLAAGKARNLALINQGWNAGDTSFGRFAHVSDVFDHFVGQAKHPERALA